MRTAQEDQRVFKTQKLIRSAVAELMISKSVKVITVREIAEHAHISRGTFYLHYKDVFDVVERIEQGILDELNGILDKVYVKPEDSLSLLMTEVFRLLARNADITPALLSERGDIAFLERSKRLVKERALTFWSETHSAGSMGIFKHHLCFIVAGSFGLLQEWLEGGMKETPEEMAVIGDRLIREGSAVLRGS